MNSCETSGCCWNEQGHLPSPSFESEACSRLSDLLGAPGCLVDQKKEEWITEDPSPENAIAITNSEDHCTCYRFSESSRNSSYQKSASSVESLAYDNEHTKDILNAEESQMLVSNQCKPGERYASRVEELQLDLLECALEYEVKILELKMKMVQMRSQNDPTHIAEAELTLPQFTMEQMEAPAFPGRLEKMLSQRLDTCRRKMSRLQGQRDSLAKELTEFRKKQRKFELQKRNMEDLLRRVNNLQRKLVKKEEEMVECQLKEKEARARLHEIQMALQRSKAKSLEPDQLIKLIPSIRSWLRSLKKTVPIKGNQRQLLQVEQFEAVLGRILENAPPELWRKPGQMSQSMGKVTKGNSGPKLDHNSPVDGIKEVYALQKELQRLAANR